MTAIAATAGAVALVVAAGVGQRLAGDGPKAFVTLRGEPLLVHAVRAVAACEAVADIVLVVGDEHRRQAQAALRDAGLSVRAVVAGGGTRTESVSRGLVALDDTRVIAVHDAARPLVTPELIRRTLAALVDPWAAVAPGLPVVDTVKQVGGPRAEGVDVLRTVDRRDLWNVQTPQVFSVGTLRRAHAGVRGDATDDLTLVERAGGRVRLVEGDRRNFKVTFPEDLVMAEALLAGERLR